MITLGIQVYEIVRPLHPTTVINIMQQIPNLNINDLQKLDEKVMHLNPLTNTTNQPCATGSIVTQTLTNSTRPNKIDKTRKDLFKKITSHLIGGNVLANLFRNPPQITDLQPINNNKTKKSTNFLDSRDNDTGLQHIFSK